MNVFTLNIVVSLRYSVCFNAEVMKYIQNRKYVLSNIFNNPLNMFMDYVQIKANIVKQRHLFTFSLRNVFVS